MFRTDHLWLVVKWFSKSENRTEPVKHVYCRTKTKMRKTLVTSLFELK